MTTTPPASTPATPPSGTWTGFFLEDHRRQPGWMNLYLDFSQGQIRGEGVDYVGPWKIEGVFDADSLACQWTKQYLGQHTVRYEGRFGQQGIRGVWQIGSRGNGDFHIWPEAWGDQTQRYLQVPPAAEPSMPLGTVPVGPAPNLA